MCLDASDLIATLRDQNRQVFIIDNLKAMGETTSDARKAVANYAKKLPFDRAAMVGDGTAIMRFSTNLMLRAIGRSNIRYFSSVDGAMIWFGLDPAEVRV
jgi:UDP-N-acetylmuramyl pentapeptide synthase